MADAVIVSTARTPIGRAFRGVFNDTHGADMGAHVIKHAAERAKVELGEVEDVILGCAAPEGTTGSNVARVSAIRAGAPVSVSGVTVNRFCSSGLQTISMAAQRVLVDKVPVMIAGTAIKRNVPIGTRATFADLGQTVAEILGAERLAHGTSFLSNILVERNRAL